MTEFFALHPLTVIKLGGSLLDLPDLSDRLQAFFSRHHFERPVIIPGGGQLADEVRRLDVRHRLGDDVAHELGVRTLALTSRVVANLSTRFHYVSDPRQPPEIWKVGDWPVFDTTELALHESQLPASWDVTSDSIAAWMSSLHPQSTLILLKSVPLPEGLSFEEAARKGLVDRYFPLIAVRLPAIFWGNLRAKSPETLRWNQ